MRGLMRLSMIAGAPAFLFPIAIIAQTFPAKPIRLIVPSAPGGGADVTARIIGPKMSEYLRQQVVIENRAGAGTMIGGEAVARAAPDGYTIAYATTSAMVMRPFLTKNTPYNTLTDFTPISQVGEAVACVIVNNSLPV